MTILKFIINYLNSNHSNIIKFFSITLIAKIFIHHFLSINYAIISPIITALNFFLTLGILSILILGVYYLAHASKYYFIALILLTLSLVVNFFDGDNYFLLRSSRHLIIFLTISFLYFLTLYYEDKENRKAFYSFIYISLVLFLMSNLFKDIGLFYENARLEKAILFLQEKNLALLVIASLFLYIDMVGDMLKNKMNKIKLFFALTISIVYTFIFFWALAYREFMPRQFNLLGNLVDNQNFQWLYYFIFILYYFDERKNEHLTSFALLVLSISFGVDNLFNSFFVITGFFIILLSLLKKRELKIALV